MVAITSLWPAIGVSTALTWIAAALIWTVLPWHKRDYAALPDEDAVLAALRSGGLRPGQYSFPHLAALGDSKDEGTRARFAQGPVGFLTAAPTGLPSMGKSMALSVVFYLLVGIAVAYVASRSLMPGQDYLTVFRIVCTTAWLAYGAGVVPEAIWFSRPWSSVAKQLFDALIYGLLTAGAFAWLWPST